MSPFGPFDPSQPGSAVIPGAITDWGTDVTTTRGLTYGYLGGRAWDSNGVLVNIVAGTIVLVASSTNYVEHNSEGVVSVNQSGFTANAFPMAVVVTSTTFIRSVTDWRLGDAVANAANIGLAAEIAARIAGDAASIVAAGDNAAAIYQAYPELVGEVGVTDVTFPYGDSRRYGTIGDGVTDDTDAVQATIDSAASLGFTAYFAGGRYLCSSRITLPSNVAIVGQSRFGSRWVFNWTLATDPAGATYVGNEDQVNGNTNISISKLGIEGAGNGTPYGNLTTPVAGTLFRLGSNITVTDCFFYRIPSISCSLQGIQRARITGNIIYQGGRDGINFRSYGGVASTDAVISHNIIYEVGDDGIAISANGDAVGPTLPSRISIVGNVIYGQSQFYANGAGRGIFLFCGEDITISANVVSSTFASGINLTGDATSGYGLRNIVVTGNAVRAAGTMGNSTQPRHGIRAIGPAVTLSITNNIIDQAVQSGINILDNANVLNPVTDVIIADNIVTRCGLVVTDFGIYTSVQSGVAATVSRVLIAKNRVHGGVGGGIRAQAVHNVTILDNIVSDNGSGQSGSTDNSAAGISVTGQGLAPTVIVRGNVCYDTRGVNAKQTYGLVFPTTSGAVGDATIEDNILANNQTAGLKISQSPTVLIQRNNRQSVGTINGRAVLVAGTIIVNTTEILAADNVVLTRVIGGGTARGQLEIGTIVAGTSFVINAKTAANVVEANDTSTVYWEIVH